MAGFAENIRLVIWDLDNTFWTGTLEEGAIDVPAAHADILKQLSRRGIVNSICSKNRLDAVQAVLEHHGLWEWFVFPRVDYRLKADMVRDIIEQMGLRPQSVLFIDDNPFNRGEVRERVPGVNVVDETFIDSILEDPQLQGKPDPALVRLERYRVLQIKQNEIASTADPAEFLRGCDIRLSVHFDVAAEFERIHDLVNRTNQLNFTKVRWNEDLETARRDFQSSDRKTFNRHIGYVKVADRFGFYGICGFFEIAFLHGTRVATHYLFSCRVLNMGVEQFVYQMLKFPRVTAVGECVASLTKSQAVDWIRVVADAEGASVNKASIARVDLCLRGPCELVQSAHYLRPFFNVMEEFPYPKFGWGIHPPLARNYALADELAERGITSVEQLGLPRDFLGIDLSTVRSSFFTGTAEIGAFSLSAESEISLYRHRRTGLLIPLSIGGVGRADLSTLPASEILKARPQIKASHIEAMAREFEFASHFDLGQLRQDLLFLRRLIESCGKPAVFVEAFDNLAMLNKQKYRDNKATNELVRDVFEGCSLVGYASMRDCVTSKDMEVDLNHFQRDAYMRLAKLLQEAANTLLGNRAGEPRTQSVHVFQSAAV